MVRAFTVEQSDYKTENVVIGKTTNSKGRYYRSSYEQIQIYLLKTEEEVMLANVIYLNLK